MLANFVKILGGLPGGDLGDDPATPLPIGVVLTPEHPAGTIGEVDFELAGEPSIDVIAWPR